VNRQCKHCNQSFEVTAGDLEFYKKVSPLFNGKISEIPPPTFCPDCRQQRRMTFRNERKLYADECEKCNKKIISLYSPDKKYHVYCPDCFMAGNWEPRDYAREYDLTRPFFEQFQELRLEVPRIALFAYYNENSDYTNHSSKNKNCYIGTGFGDCEDCMFGHWVLHSKNVVDGLYVDYSEQCYDCSYCVKCWQSYFCNYCSTIKESLLCFECKDCSNCIGCVQLHHQKFQILNKPVAPEEFERVRGEILGSRKKFEEFKAEYRRLILAAPRRYTYQVGCEDSFGDDLWNCKNAVVCFNTRELEDCKYMYDLGNNRSSMDCFEHGYLIPSELNYETHSGMDGYHLLFCNLCWEARDLILCELCGARSHDLFGCVGVRREEYCILNKQYSRSEYEALVPKIIESMKGEWGEFMPSALSPFGYNETVTPEYYPLAKDAALKQGFNWSDYDAPPPTAKKIIKGLELPENIALISDEILNCGIECEVTGRLFRITKAELAFYRQHSLPLPTKHPDQRHIERMQLRNPRKLVSRFCESCGESVQSTFRVDSPEMVYCGSCYEKAVYTGE